MPNSILKYQQRKPLMIVSTTNACEISGMVKDFRDGHRIVSVLTTHVHARELFVKRVIFSFEKHGPQIVVLGRIRSSLKEEIQEIAQGRGIEVLIPKVEEGTDRAGEAMVVGCIDGPATVRMIDHCAQQGIVLSRIITQEGGLAALDSGKASSTREGRLLARRIRKSMLNARPGSLMVAGHENCLHPEFHKAFGDLRAEEGAHCCAIRRAEGYLQELCAPIGCGMRRFFIPREEGVVPLGEAPVINSPAQVLMSAPQ